MLTIFIYKIKEALTFEAKRCVLFFQSVHTRNALLCRSALYPLPTIWSRHMAEADNKLRSHRTTRLPMIWIPMPPWNEDGAEEIWVTLGAIMTPYSTISAAMLNKSWMQHPSQIITDGAPLDTSSRCTI